MRVYAQLLLVAWVLGCGRIGYAPLHEPAPEPGIDGGAGGWNADSGPSDGALPDAGLDGTIDACTSSSGIEVCNGLDDDCDGTIDEGDPSLLCPAPNATSVCSNGNCSLTGCVGPYGDCDGVSANGCEEPLNTPTSCGGCEVACALEHASASCAGGSCEILGCDTHWGNCNAVDSDGCETPLTTLGNCGACNAGCDYANAGESCGGGACSLGACDTHWGNCNAVDSDGCETPLTTLTDCGACASRCARANAAASCSGGSCTIGACDPGWANCNATDADGCETSLLTLADCGLCGARCDHANASESCASGTCQLVSCDAGYDDCDGNPANGCELVPTWYRDRDGDGYGDPGQTQQACTQPPGYVSGNRDCDDDPGGCGASCNPSLTESRADSNCLDGFDNDCDARSDGADSGCRGPAKMYWTDSDTDTIKRANLDGSNVETLYGDTSPDFRGISVDSSAGRIYWVGRGNGTVGRMNADGTNRETVVSGLGTPWGVAVDGAGGTIYYTDTRADRIYRANLDGSDQQTILSGLDDPLDLALDLARGKIYWTTRNSSKNVRRANLDGSSPETVVTGLSDCVGVAIDSGGGKIYYSNQTAGEIYRANLDGSGQETIVTSSPQPRGLGEPDVVGGKLYYVDSGNDLVRRANLDGTNVETLVSSGVLYPKDIALH